MGYRDLGGDYDGWVDLGNQGAQATKAGGVPGLFVWAATSGRQQASDSNNASLYAQPAGDLGPDPTACWQAVDGESACSGHGGLRSFAASDCGTAAWTCNDPGAACKASGSDVFCSWQAGLGPPPPPPPSPPSATPLSPQQLAAEERSRKALAAARAALTLDSAAEVLSTETAQERRRWAIAAAVVAASAAATLVYRRHRRRP